MPTGSLTQQSARTTQNVDNFTAVGNGTADDHTAIMAAMSAAYPGGTVKLGAKKYGIGSPIEVYPTVTLEGQNGRRVQQAAEATDSSLLYCLPAFSGAAALLFYDKEQGSYAGDNNGIRLRHLSVDGSAISSGSVDGIKATGKVHDAILENVSLYGFSHNGITTTSYTRVDTSVVHPYSWYLIDCMVNAAGNDGYNFNGLTDSTLLSVESLGAREHGFVLQNMPNSRFIGCQAEWSTQHGFYVTGSWGSGQGSGGAVFSACTTDRNGHDGIHVDATGNGSLRFSAIQCRRDGRNGGTGGGGYAGFACSSSTMPIVFDVETYPGVDDDGTGTASPDYGASFTSSSNISAIGGYLHGVVAGWHDGGGNSFLRRNLNVLESTGSTGSPTRVSSTPWNTNGQGTVALTANDQTAFTITNTGNNTNNPLLAAVTASSSGDGLETSKVSGDSVNRFKQFADGKVEWGSGSATRDTNLYRASAGVLTTDNNLDVVLHSLGIATPREHGLVAWTFDPAAARSSKAGVAGTVYLVGVYVPRAATITKIYWGLGVLANGVTNTQNWVGLYNSAGTLLQSTDVSTPIGASTGLITTAITSQAVTPGLYWVAFVFNASVMPQLHVGGDLSAALLNAGIDTASTYRFATNGTGQTTLPSTITPSSNSIAQFAYWAALG